jgi:hypothetical protein
LDAAVIHDPSIPGHILEHIPEFKLILLGDVNMGKTTFLKRLQEVDWLFESKKVETLNIVVHPIIFHTNRGLIKFNYLGYYGAGKRWWTPPWLLFAMQCSHHHV